MSELTGTESAPWFFLSYAHPRGTAVLDPWVTAFHADLSARLSERAAPADPHGYVDQPGESPPVRRERRIDALSRCKSLVVLYSPDYFADPECHSEWSAFRSRLAPDGSADTAIVPVLWERLWNDGPGEVALDRKDLGLRFGENGLRTALAKRQLAAYRAGLDRVAAAILRAVTKLDLVAVPPVALRHEPRPWEDHPAVRSLRIQVLARTSTGGAPLPPGCDPEEYGELPELWRPYYAEDGTRTLAELAAEVARGYNVHVTAVEGFGTPAAAGARPVPRLLLLDRWALREPRLSGLLLPYGGRRHPVAVMVPWVPRPPLSAGAEHGLRELQQLTLSTLDDAVGRPKPDYDLLRRGIPDVAAFVRLLPTALRQARGAFTALRKPPDPDAPGANPLPYA